MKKAELVALLERVTVDELKGAIPLKEKMEKLEKQRKNLEKQLASVVKQIEALGIPKVGLRIRTKKKGVTKAKRKRIAQPSLSSLVVEILKEKKKSLTINDICDALLREKHYQTRAKDFKAQVRVMMYRNDKGLFKKASPGLFKLAGGSQGASKTRKKTAKKAVRKVGKGTSGKMARKATGKVVNKSTKKKTKKTTTTKTKK